MASEHVSSGRISSHCRNYSHAAILLQRKSVVQVLAVNVLMRISIVKIVCECFCHDRKAGLRVFTWMKVTAILLCGSKPTISNHCRNYSHAAILLQKKSVIQVLAVNVLMRISIVKIVCECFCHDRKAGFRVFTWMKSDCHTSL